MRVLKVSICCLLSSLLLWSCAPLSPVDDTSENLTDTQEHSVNSDIPAIVQPTTRESLNAEQELKKRLYEFLNALVSSDKEKLIALGGVKVQPPMSFGKGQI